MAKSKKTQEAAANAAPVGETIQGEDLTMTVIGEKGESVKEDMSDELEILPASEHPDKEKVEYGKKILSQKKTLDAVYIVDGLFYANLERAKGRAYSTKGIIYKLGK